MSKTKVRESFPSGVYLTNYFLGPEGPPSTRIKGQLRQLVDLGLSPDSGELPLVFPAFVPAVHGREKIFQSLDHYQLETLHLWGKLRGDGYLTRPQIPGPISLLSALLANSEALSPADFKAGVNEVRKHYLPLLFQYAQAKLPWLHLEENFSLATAQPLENLGTLPETKPDFRNELNQIYLDLYQEVTQILAQNNTSIIVNLPQSHTLLTGPLSQMPQIRALGLPGEEKLSQNQLPALISKLAQTVETQDPIQTPAVIAQVISVKSLIRSDLEDLLQLLQSLEAYANFSLPLLVGIPGGIVNCPEKLREEKQLDEILRNYVAGAQEKLEEAQTLAWGLAHGKNSVATALVVDLLAKSAIKTLPGNQEKINAACQLRPQIDALTQLLDLCPVQTIG